MQEIKVGGTGDFSKDDWETFNQMYSSEKASSFRKEILELGKKVCFNDSFMGDLQKVYPEMRYADSDTMKVYGYGLTFDLFDEKQDKRFKYNLDIPIEVVDVESRLILSFSFSPLQEGLLPKRPIEDSKEMDFLYQSLEETMEGVKVLRKMGEIGDNNSRYSFEHDALLSEEKVSLNGSIRTDYQNASDLEEHLRIAHKLFQMSLPKK